MSAKLRAQAAVRWAVKSGSLVRPSKCERCGAEGEVHGHHEDYSKSLDVVWLCRVCHGAVHRVKSERQLSAENLRGEGLSNAEIGRRLGVNGSTVYKWLNPEKAREWNRQQNAARREAKREWARNNRATCPECGAIRGVNSGSQGTLCRPCSISQRGEQKEARWDDIERWWNEGIPGPEIAKRLGWEKSSCISVELNAMRKAGRDVPYRYNEERREKMARARWKEAA